MSLALSIPAVAAEPTSGEQITGYTRPVILLRHRLTDAPEPRNRSDLPAPVSISGHDGDFFRFEDPKTGQSWLVSKFDAITNAQRTAVVPKSHGPCLVVGSMGMGSPCPR